MSPATGRELLLLLLVFVVLFAVLSGGTAMVVWYLSGG